jgi:hypothetical protein
MPKLNVKQKIFEGRPSDDTLQNCIAWLQMMLDQVSEEYKDTAEITFESIDDYGCHGVEVQVFYYRPETDEEEHNRVSKERRIAVAKRDQEMAEYIRLKSKFES